MPKKPSAQPDHRINLRLPGRLNKRLQEWCEASGRNRTAEIVHRLDLSDQGYEERFLKLEAEVSSLKAALKRSKKS